MKGYQGAGSGSVDRARELRRNATDAEKHLWRALRETFPQAKFRRQSLVAPYYPDFLSYRHMLIIEVDGGQHSNETDAVRTRFLQAKGFQVIRFWNNDVLANTHGVLLEIAKALDLRGPPSPSHADSRRGPLPLASGEERSAGGAAG